MCFRCKFCQRYVEPDHLCHVQPLDPKKVNPEKGFREILWDVEAYANKETGEHVPYCICALRRCEVCSTKEESLHPDKIKRECDNCGQRWHVFKGNGDVEKMQEDFFGWLFFEPVGFSLMVFIWVMQRKRFSGARKCHRHRPQQRQVRLILRSLLSGGQWEEDLGRPLHDRK